MLISLPDRVGIDDLQRVFTLFQRYMAEHYMHTIEANDFHNALEELDGTFIEIDLLSVGVRAIRFHNPSIRDFLEVYLSEHTVVINILVRSVQFFSQLRWLWGKYQIGFRHAKKPVQIKPRYREHLLKTPDDFVQGLTRTIHSESPFLHITSKTDYKSYSLAGRLLILIEINHVLKDARLNDLLSKGMPILKDRAQLGEESSFELMKLAKSLKKSVYFSDVKVAFLASLSSLPDFERYLIFKLRYRNKLTADDEAYVDKRFSDLYPGQDMSYIDAYEDYDYEDNLSLLDFDDDNWLNDKVDVIHEIKEKKKISQRENDPNEIISDLFDGLNT